MGGGAREGLFVGRPRSLIDGGPEAQRRAAMRFLNLRLVRRACPLVIACGLPAIGKSTVARVIAASLRPPVTRSDVRPQTTRRVAGQGHGGGDGR